MQISSREISNKKSLQNSIWEGLGLHLGGAWDGLGRLLGALGPLLPVFLRLKSIYFATLVQDGLQEPTGIDFGRVLGGFGKVWGRFLELWGTFWTDFGSFWPKKALLGQILV